MCIIIHKPSDDVQLDEYLLEDLAQINPDGAGITWLDTGTTHKTKNMKTAVKWGMSSRPYLLHYRYATVGSRSAANVHPFDAGRHGLLYMNGTVKGFGGTKKTDAEHLADIVAQLDDPAVLLDAFGARFAIVSGEGAVTRFGDWVEYDGYFASKEIDYLDIYPPFDDGLSQTSRTLIGVYGTLKCGHNNDHYLDGCEFVGYAKTVNNHRLCINGLPYLIQGENSFGEGCPVELELYLVDRPTLQAIDHLEGHPHWYKREQKAVALHGQSANRYRYPWIYFADESMDDGGYHTSYDDLPPQATLIDYMPDADDMTDA